MELIVVCIILVVMAGTLFTVTSSSKRSANDSASVSNLHQLGLAAGLYEADRHVWPGSVKLLHPTYVKDVRLFASANDPHPKGLITMRGMHLEPSPFKISYFGMDDISGPEIREMSSTYGTSAEGLFFDLSYLAESTHESFTEFAASHRRYSRLTVGLSVLRKTPPGVVITPDGGICTSPSLFLDDYESGLETFCK
ncbi:MAG: hypothetical protein SFX74_11260 [Fimbriimonadaceae bacterium]|nr:hypothetical protein [Fimbriimonadaceae bacterium]